METNVDDRERGLYTKYTVFRNDGSSEPGGKHERCYYFILDLDHDPFALPALMAYADACEKDGYDLLAADLRKEVESRGGSQ